MDRVSGWAASGAIAAERLIDGLILSGLLALALRLAPPEQATSNVHGLSIGTIYGALYTATIVFLLGSVLMGGYHLWPRAGRVLIRHTVGLASKGWAERVANRLEEVAHSLAFLSKPRFSLPYLFLTIAYWLTAAGAAWFLAREVGLDTINFSQAFVAVGLISLGTLIPSGPGFFGAFQVASYAALALYFPFHKVVAQGAVFVFITYTVQIGTTVLAGLGALWLERRNLGVARRPNLPGPHAVLKS